ncbi:FGFR1 oncogene partner 2 isoform X2 [Anomalospiza imberbis]|uniref:FGFR1 oncogene partner 2 isoform X2 n=1 Tax=Anomalospiza imberbis TaxID=187417 RepID=UPI00358FEC06
MKMSCTIEKALADAKALVERLREHDSAAEALIEQTTALNKRVEAMKQYQEEIQELNEVARHRPRSTLVMGIQQENRQIRELQQENKELRTSLEEHQSALELIMSKYREQMFRLLMASKKDDPSIIMKLKEQHSKREMPVHGLLLEIRLQTPGKNVAFPAVLTRVEQFFISRVTHINSCCTGGRGQGKHSTIL